MSEFNRRGAGPGHSLDGHPARTAHAEREGEADREKQKVESREQKEIRWLMGNISRLSDAIRMGCAHARTARYRDHRAAHLTFARDVARVARADWTRLKELRRATV